MKKSLKKVILACSAVAALMVAMSASAMAASTATADYDSATTKATVTVSGAAASGQVTLLVLKPNSDGTVNTGDVAVASTDIAYIDQTAADSNGAITFTVPLSSTATSGVYLVKVGGEDGSIASTTFSTSTTPITYTLGDVNNDSEVTNLDAIAVLRYEVGNITKFTDSTDTTKSIPETYGDTNHDGEVTNLDAIQILRFEVGSITTF